MAGTRIGFGRHALTPASSPSAPRRPGGSLPTRSWWPSTAGSAAVRTPPAGYRGHVEGLGPPLEGISGGHRVPNAFARVGREKVRAPWGPRVPSVLGGGIKVPVPRSASPKCPRHCRVPHVPICGGDTKIPVPWPTAPCSVISRPHTSPSLCYGPAVPTALYSPCHGPTVPPSPVLRLDPKSPRPHDVSPRCVPFYSDQRAAAAAITDIRDQLLHLLLLLGTPTTGGERAGDGDPGATRPHRGRGHLHRGRATERLGPGACREGHANRAGHRGAGGDAAHHAAPRAAAGHGHPGPGRPRAPRHPPAPHLQPLTQNGAAAGPQPASAAHHALPERPHRGR